MDGALTALRKRIKRPVLTLKLNDDTDPAMNFPSDAHSHFTNFLEALKVVPHLW